MHTQLDIVYKLKEALETGNPEVAAPFMADDFTHQALPAQCVRPIGGFILELEANQMLISNAVPLGLGPLDARKINGKPTSLESNPHSNLSRWELTSVIPTSRKKKHLVHVPVRDP